MARLSSVSELTLAVILATSPASAHCIMSFCKDGTATASTIQATGGASAFRPERSGRRARRSGDRAKTRYRQKSSAAIAKFRACASLSRNVVTPIRLPKLSNNPPPDDPGEIGAVVRINWPFIEERKPEIMPSPKVRSRPLGAPTV